MYFIITKFYKSLHILIKIGTPTWYNKLHGF